MNRPHAAAPGGEPEATGASHGYILVVDDEPEIRRLIQEILEDEHYKVVTAENAVAARDLYRRHRPDLVLLDIWMPDTDGITLLKEWARDGGLERPVVMMSGHGTVETAVEATRLGAYDFIEKPLSMGKLLVTVERALESETLRRENLRLRRQAEPASFVVGRSELIQQLREVIERVAATDAWVLITGEPGTGKAVAARYLHTHSARRERPLVEFSVAADGPVDLTTRLFGAERDGRVTSGALEQASGGALVLNDVADLNSATQGLLANTVRDKRFVRVGGHDPLEFDARLIAVSSRDLHQAVLDGGFREDLYYRLNVVPLPLPALREHREDVVELVNFYRDWLVDKEQLPYRKFSTGSLNLLRNYGWPGNIRELRNVVQRLLILDRGGEVSEEEVRQAIGAGPAPATGAYPGTLMELPLRAAREQFEKAYLEQLLARAGGNVAEVARLAEMERTHLYRKLKQLGISPKTIKE